MSIRFVAVMVIWALAGNVQAGEPEESVSVLETKSDFNPSILIQFAVSDLERSVHFYRDVVGLQFELQNDSLRWARFKTAIPGVTLGLGESNVVNGSGTTSLNLAVSDIDKKRAQLEERGVEFLGPTKNIPGVVRLADFLDPDGNKIRLAGQASDASN